MMKRFSMEMRVVTAAFAALLAIFMILKYRQLSNRQPASAGEVQVVSVPDLAWIEPSSDVNFGGPMPGSIKLRWRTPPNVDPGAYTVLEFSDQANFQKIRTRMPVRTPGEETLSFTKDVLSYVRVRIGNHYSSPRRLSYRKVEAPVWTQKPDARYTTTEDESAGVTLSWRKAKEEVDFEVAMDSSFSEVILKGKTDQGTAHFQARKGEYFIRGQFPAATTPVWSETAAFRITGPSGPRAIRKMSRNGFYLIPSPPDLLSFEKKSTAEISRFIFQRGDLRDELRSQLRPKMRTVVLAHPSNHRLVTDVSDGRWPANLMKPGKHNVILRYENKDFRPVSGGERYRLTIFSEAPQSTILTKGRVIRWGPSLFAKAYQVDISPQNNFIQKMTVKTNPRFYRFEDHVGGTYWWRVRALDAAGEVISDWSEPKKVVIFGVPKTRLVMAGSRRMPASVDETQRPSLLGVYLKKLDPRQWGGRFTAWLGTGLQHSQISESLVNRVGLSDGDSRFGGATVGLDYQTKNWGAAFTARLMSAQFSFPGEGSGPVSFSGTNLGVEYLKPIGDGDGKGWSADLRAGLFQQESPLVYFDENNQPQMGRERRHVASLGVSGEKNFGRRWRSYGLFRYQIPLASQTSAGSLKMKTKLLADGTLGMSYRWKPQAQAGVFWSAQTSQGQVTDSSVPNASDGQQSLLSSSLDLRLGFEL